MTFRLGAPSITIFGSGAAGKTVPAFARDLGRWRLRRRTGNLDPAAYANGGRCTWRLCGSREGEKDLPSCHGGGEWNGLSLGSAGIADSAATTNAYRRPPKLSFYVAMIRLMTRRPPPREPFQTPSKPDHHWVNAAKNCTKDQSFEGCFRHPSAYADPRPCAALPIERLRFVRFAQFDLPTN